MSVSTTSTVDEESNRCLSRGADLSFFPAASHSPGSPSMKGSRGFVSVEESIEKQRNYVFSDVSSENENSLADSLASETTLPHKIECDATHNLKLCDYESSFQYNQNNKITYSPTSNKESQPLNNHGTEFITSKVIGYTDAGTPAPSRKFDTCTYQFDHTIDDTSLFSSKQDSPINKKEPSRIFLNNENSCEGYNGEYIHPSNSSKLASVPPGLYYKTTSPNRYNQYQHQSNNNTHHFQDPDPPPQATFSSLRSDNPGHLSDIQLDSSLGSSSYLNRGITSRSTQTMMKYKNTNRVKQGYNFDDVSSLKSPTGKLQLYQNFSDNVDPQGASSINAINFTQQQRQQVRSDNNLGERIMGVSSLHQTNENSEISQQDMRFMKTSFPYSTSFSEEDKNMRVTDEHKFFDSSFAHEKINEEKAMFEEYMNYHRQKFMQEKGMNSLIFHQDSVANFSTTSQFTNEETKEYFDYRSPKDHCNGTPNSSRTSENQVPSCVPTIKENSCYKPSTPMLVYVVKFKRCHRFFITGQQISRQLKIGCYVKVEADRGDDLGIVINHMSMAKFISSRSDHSYTSENTSEKAVRTIASMPFTVSPTSELKKIVRLATNDEVTLLAYKNEEERELLRVCQEKVLQRNLPMNVTDAEFQFDRNKLTFFFEAEGRVDFRELVRDLFSIYKTRIWMQQIDKNSPSTLGFLNQGGNLGF